jgi:hypothetical protein
MPPGAEQEPPRPGRVRCLFSDLTLLFPRAHCAVPASPPCLPRLTRPRDGRSAAVPATRRPRRTRCRRCPAGPG